MFVVDGQKKLRVNYLLSITGSNFSEIQPPEGGWRSFHKYHLKNDKLPFGKFFIKEHAIIDYMQEDYTIFDLQNYHPSLLNLAIDQLELKCSEILRRKSSVHKFPNIHFLLLKFYGLR